MDCETNKYLTPEDIRTNNNAIQDVGLTVGGPVPRTAIRIKGMLNQLPLLK